MLHKERLTDVIRVYKVGLFYERGFLTTAYIRKIICILDGLERFKEIRMCTDGELGCAEVNGKTVVMHGIRCITSGAEDEAAKLKDFVRGAEVVIMEGYVPSGAEAVVCGNEVFADEVVLEKVVLYKE